ncbi:MAG: hypothetical protein AB1805_08120 [Nitrospirota bacterium]
MMKLRNSLSTFTVLVIVILFAVEFVDAQIAPPSPLDNVKIQARATLDDTGKYNYYYTVSNPQENTLSISEIALDVEVSPGGVKPSELYSLPMGYKKPSFSQLVLAEQRGYRVVPFAALSVSGWDSYGLTFEHKKGVSLLGSRVAASWARWRESVPPIMPGQTLGEFQLISYGLPGIRNMVAKPDVFKLNLPDDWTEQEDDTSEIMDEKWRKQESLGYVIKTIGPTALPAAFLPVEFNRLIQGYVEEAALLGWLRDAVLAQKVRELLAQSDHALREERYVDAQTILQQLITLVHEGTHEQRTDEAAALLYYNMQYLYDRIVDYIPTAIEILTPRTIERTLNEIHKTEVRVMDGIQPDSNYPLHAMVVAGPHQGLEWYGSSDDQGKWSFSYKGERIGTDKIIFVSMLAYNADYYWSGEGESAPIYVTWKGGPDLMLRTFFPPLIKIPFGRPTIPLEETTINIGTVAVPPSKTRYYLSKDQQLDMNDMVIGERLAPELAVEQFSEHKEEVPVPQDLEPGLYWLFGCTDAAKEIAELNEENNCRTLVVQMFGFVESTGNNPPDCSRAKPSPASLWPPDHKFRAVSINGITDPDNDLVSITISSVHQDEPVNGLGDGDTGPDGALQPLQIRSERSGKGNGRIYRIGFTASDRRGGECSGVVTVCAPHDQGKRAQCIDEGPLYDSTHSEGVLDKRQ